MSNENTEQNTVFCQKLNQNLEKLAKPPYPGELGQKIYNNISKEAWTMWLGHQTMLINEYRLSLIEPKAREFLQQEMISFLFPEENKTPENN